MQPTIEIEKYLLKNKRQIEMAITHLTSFHGRSVTKGTKLNDVSLDNIFSKLILPLQISILEIEFNRIVNRNSTKILKPAIDSNLFQKKTLTEKWTILLKFLYTEKYLKPNGKFLTSVSIGDTAFHRYQTVNDLITKDLNAFVELRNRLSHGQWDIAFNHDILIKNQDLTTAVWTLTKKEIMIIKAFVSNLPILIALLTQSQNAFEKDYDKYVGKIQRAIQDADFKYAVFQKRKLK